ncbi:hypothetical protein [Pararobbsia alpina]|uniref:Uncharacterized protein n=1 Tax=Pararobbsia alpina TaxID=621374 RepID=A0A6S7BL33_9BURK|nr:hypothetical protein [Pararobbsia alpina]CAB3802683.1 hypothetical protein LMG28138_05230 [Pararobbsia alpina]
MNFGLLVLQLPHVREPRAHDDTPLSLPSVDQHQFAAIWQRLKTLFS